MVKRVTIGGQKLAALRRERYLTQQELAERLDMSLANIRRLEQSEVGGMQMKNFRRLAELLKIPPDELQRRIGAPFETETENGRGGNRRPERFGPQPSALIAGTMQPVVDIDRFHGVSAAQPEDRERVDRGQTPVPTGAAERFSVIVDGDCMEPKYRHGDVVIFSVEAVDREGILDGRNYFIQFNDGENTFKRVFVDADNGERLILRCWNEDYPSRSVERSSIKLLARAIYKLVPDEG